MYLFQRIRLYLDFAVMTTYKAVNIIPLKYVLIRQVQFLQVQWNQHFFNRGHVYIDQTYTVIY